MRSVGIITLGALVVSGIGVVADTLWTLSTLALSHPVLPSWPIWVLFALIFPLHTRTVLIATRRRNDRPRRHFNVGELRTLKRLLGVRLAVIGSALFAGYWIIAMTSFIWLGKGNPEQHGQRFYADNHGVLTEISERSYHHLQLAEQRLFTAIPAAFF